MWNGGLFHIVERTKYYHIMNHHNVYQTLQAFMASSLKLFWGSLDSKWHAEQTIATKRGPKCCQEPIVLVHDYLQKTVLWISNGENFGFSKFGRNILYGGIRVMISDYTFVWVLCIKALNLFGFLTTTILLIQGVGSRRLCENTHVLEFINLVLELIFDCYWYTLWIFLPVFGNWIHVNVVTAK